MNAQVENAEVVEVEVPEIAIPGGQQKYKLVVNVPVEVEHEGETYSVVAPVEFGPFDTTDRVEAEQAKFLDRGYASSVATIFTCSSVRLALSSFPKVEVHLGDEVEADETESTSNADAVETLLTQLDAPVDATVLREGEDGRVVDVAESYEAAQVEYADREAVAAGNAEVADKVSEPAKDETETETAEAPKPAPRPRRQRKSAATA